MPYINVHYFALLRDQAGIEVETTEFEQSTLKALYQKLAQKHQFNLPSDMIQVAVNDEFCSMNDNVVAGSKIVFIPPVAGG